MIILIKPVHSYIQNTVKIYSNYDSVVIQHSGKMRITRKNTIDNDEIGVDAGKVKKSAKLITQNSDLQSKNLTEVRTKGRLLTQCSFCLSL